MSPSGLAREPQLAVVDGSTQHRVRDRADLRQHEQQAAEQRERP